MINCTDHGITYEHNCPKCNGRKPIDRADAEFLEAVNDFRMLEAEKLKKIESKYQSLLALVEEHNQACIAECENNKSCNKKIGYPSIKCANCPKENIINTGEE